MCIAVCGGQGHPIPAPPLQQEEQRLTERCQSLDETVVRLTTFVRQNQVSLNHILVTQKKARWVTFECGCCGLRNPPRVAWEDSWGSSIEYL